MEARMHLLETLEELRELERAVEVVAAWRSQCPGADASRAFPRAWLQAFEICRIRHATLTGDEFRSRGGLPELQKSRWTEQWHQQALRLQLNAAAVPSTLYHV